MLLGLTSLAGFDPTVTDDLSPKDQRRVAASSIGGLAGVLAGSAGVGAAARAMGANDLGAALSATAAALLALTVLRLIVSSDGVPLAMQGVELVRWHPSRGLLALLVIVQALLASPVILLPSTGATTSPRTTLSEALGLAGLTLALFAAHALRWLTRPHALEVHRRSRALVLAHHAITQAAVTIALSTWQARTGIRATPRRPMYLDRPFDRQPDPRGGSVRADPGQQGAAS